MIKILKNIKNVPLFVTADLYITLLACLFIFGTITNTPGATVAAFIVLGVGWIPVVIAWYWGSKRTTQL